MKVWIICPGGLADKGGIGRLVDYFTNALSVQANPPVCRIVDSRGSGSLVWSPFYFLRTLLCFSKAALYRDVDLLHVHLASYGSTVRKFCVVYLGKFFGVPNILHLHGAKYHIFYRNLPKVFKSLVRLMFGQATRVIVLGNFWREFVCNEIGVNPSQVVVMYNAVPSPETPTSPRDVGPFRIIFLGQIGTRKGVPELIQALATEKVHALDWTCTIAGNGDIATYLEEVNRLALNDRVTFPGWLDKGVTKHLLEKSDILVLPSHQEGLPMAVLEGIAHGLIVITTPVGAIDEIIEDGVSGLLIPPGNSSALAEAICRVLNDSDLRRRLSEGARKRFEEKLNLQSYAIKLRILYEGCISPLSHQSK